MKVTIFEGTPEEFKAVANHLGKNAGDQPEGDGGESSRKAAYRAMLTRAEIHAGQRDMYKTLAGGELPWNEYLKRMKRSESEIRGVHGALGNRIKHTPQILESGLPGNMAAISTWDQGKKVIGLRPEFVEVLQELKLV